MNNLVLLKPVLTEKSLNKANVYVFQVSLFANKAQVKHAIESIYKVKVDRVKIVVKKGKTKLLGRRRVTKSLSNTKKAYVTLKSGEIEDIKVQ